MEEASGSKGLTLVRSQGQRLEYGGVVDFGDHFGEFYPAPGDSCGVRPSIVQTQLSRSRHPYLRQWT